MEEGGGEGGVIPFRVCVCVNLQTGCYHFEISTPLPPPSTLCLSAMGR